MSENKIKIKYVDAIVAPPRAATTFNNSEAPTVADQNKRTFLKLASVAGIGTLAAMLLPKRAQAYVLGSSPTSAVVGVKDSSNTRINPATEDGNLASINTQAQKLTFDGGSNLYVQAATGFTSQLENASNAVINPATEDSLVVVKNQLNKLTFDGSNNLLTSASGGASIVGLKDTTSTQINPSSDDSLLYLRRIVKLLEPMATADSANRQRVTIDAGTLPTVTTVTGVTTVTTVSTVTSTTNLVTIGSWDAHQMFQDVAHNLYANAIRNNLIY